MNDKISGIQGLRGIAALMVVMQHTIYYACTARGVDFRPFLPVSVGGIGVNIFFVISGYVMTLCLHQGEEFMMQRVARIYPPFWAAVLLGGLIVPFVGGGPWVPDWRYLALLPAASFNGSYAVPYWTLCFEVMFYVVIYGLILLRLSRRHIAMLLMAWASIIACICQFGSLPGLLSDEGASGLRTWIVLSPLNLFFIAGALYGLGGQQALAGISVAVSTLACCILFMLAEAGLGMPHYLQCLLWSLSHVLLVHLAAGMRLPRPLVRLGDFSYGLYLTHNTFIALAIAGIAYFAPVLPLVLMFAVVFSVAVAGGACFGACEFRLHTAVVRPGLYRLAQSA